MELLPKHRQQALEQKLADGKAVRAWATVKRCGASLMDLAHVPEGSRPVTLSDSRGSEWYLDFEVRVEPAGQEAFNAKFIAFLHGTRSTTDNLFPSGTKVPVIYDPRDRKHVGFDNALWQDIPA